MSYSRGEGGWGASVEKQYTALDIGGSFVQFTWRRRDIWYTWDLERTDVRDAKIEYRITTIQS